MLLRESTKLVKKAGLELEASDLVKESQPTSSDRSIATSQFPTPHSSLSPMRAEQVGEIGIGILDELTDGGHDKVSAFRESLGYTGSVGRLRAPMRSRGYGL